MSSSRTLTFDDKLAHCLENVFPLLPAVAAAQRKPQLVLCAQDWLEYMRFSWTCLSGNRLIRLPFVLWVKLARRAPPALGRTTWRFLLCSSMFFFVSSSVAYFGVYEYLKEAFAREDGTVSSAGILSAGGFAGEQRYRFR